jgi:hypothetical protein
VLDLSVRLNGGAIASRTDDAVHVVALPGDTTGDGSYGASDVQRLVRVGGSLDTGFAAFPRTAALVVGDLT